MWIDLAIFASFYAVNLSVHRIIEKAAHVAHDPVKAHGFGGAFSAIIVTNEPIIHAVREFVTHVIVYSGNVIPKH